MERLTLSTPKRECIIDVTAQVQKTINSQPIKDGLCFVFVPHTTAGITINENADPSVKLDISDVLARLIPFGKQYRHAEGNADSHVKASLVGSSVLIAIENGQLILGTWQGIQLCEFDGPRSRHLWVKIISA